MKIKLALILSLFSQFALAALPADHPVQPSLVSEMSGFMPGQALTVGLLMKTKPHWHTYWRDPGDAGLPTTLEFKLPAGVKASDILWPKPQVFKDPGGLTGYGYEGDNLLPAVIQVPASYAASTLEIHASASWLVCHDVCIPGSTDLSLVLPKGSGPSADAPRFSAIRDSLGKIPQGYKGETEALGSGTAIDKGSAGQSPRAAQAQPAVPEEGQTSSLALMLLFAFVGGLILNLMPCVLPVLSLKVMAFVRQSQESRTRSMALGAAFSLGAICSFWVLGATVIAARAAGQSVGWGFQFQSPAFVSVMAVVVTVFALNLFGVFELYIPGHATQAFHDAGGQEGLPGAFFTGAFMTLLATPCSAPFLGTALGFAFSQPSSTLVMVFTAVGLGLAAPYMALSSFPSLMRWVPKPGKWMLHFKQFMGFPLLATLCWLLWVLGKQTGLEFVIWMLGFLTLVGLAAWIYGAFAPWGSSWGRLGLVAALNALLLGMGYQQLLKEPFQQALAPSTAIEAGGWEPYNAGRIEALNKQGKTVFVDFTAEWCWTCKVNERVALNDAGVKEAFEKVKIVKMRADWTRKDAAITSALQGFGRSGVPFYAFYSPKFEKPITLSEVITPGAVLGAIQKIQ
jgi:thiol:disulfide interchange protein